MWQKLRNFWNGLPHQWQGAIVTFGSAAGATLIHAFEDVGLAKCQTWGCVGTLVKTALSPHMLFTAIFAGAAALKLFFMLPSNKQVPENK